jgi:transposase
MEPVLGIDVAKRHFHVALLADDGEAKPRGRSFPNNAAGFAQLAAWLHNRHVARVHACLEATGGWSEALALELHRLGHVVSIVNPQRIKDFGRSEGLRTKTDAIDAALIARFGRVHRPPAWTPASPQVRALQALARRRESLIEMSAQEQNRLAGPELDPVVSASVREHVAYLDRQIAALEEQIARLIDDDPDLRQQHELLDSIPGIGPRSATTILAEMPNLAEFRDVKAVAAHAGLCPGLQHSGTSLQRSRLSRAGNARLRRALYFPAVVAMRTNPVIRAFTQRLTARGKRPMVVITAAMRKLLTVAYGVVKSGRPFSATPAPTRA